MERVLVDGELVQQEDVLRPRPHRGHRDPAQLPGPRLDDDLAAHVDPADDPGGRLVPSDPASESRPRIEASDEGEGADDGGLLGGEVLTVPVLQQQLALQLVTAY